LIEFRGRLRGLAGGTSAAIREAITIKNHVIYEGVAFGAVGIFASAMAIIKRVGPRRETEARIKRH